MNRRKDKEAFSHTMLEGIVKVSFFCQRIGVPTEVLMPYGVVVLY